MLTARQRGCCHQVGFVEPLKLLELVEGGPNPGQSLVAATWIQLVGVCTRSVHLIMI